MKLLITTQKVDSQDDILGFMHGWIKEFAKQFEQVTVICLFEGEHDLPSNVKVLSLGKSIKKEKRKKKSFKIINRLKYIVKFYTYAWQERKNYDSVFVHMNSEYMLLGAWLWKALGKKRGLWFAHYRPNWIAKTAFRLTDIIFTSTRKACAFSADKVKVVGQGIDTEVFRPVEKVESSKTKILFLGRISPIKKIEMLIEAVSKLDNENIELNIIGAPGEAEPEKDGLYYQKLQEQVHELGLGEKVNFVGKIPFQEISKQYQVSDIFVNLTPTGSLDKTTLEAMASGNAVLVCNQAYFDILSSELQDDLIFQEDNQKELEDKLKKLINLPINERRVLGERLRQTVIDQHDLQGLIKKIKNHYEGGNL